jgi:hypothetical protein
MAQEKPHPIIGFTLDYEEAGGYSNYPWYAIRDNYCASVAKFGGIPIALPHEVALEQALSRQLLCLTHWEVAHLITPHHTFPHTSPGSAQGGA